MDGTIRRGGRALPGARELITALHAWDKAVLVMSNNPLRSAEQHRRDLARSGLELAGDEIFTSVSALLAHLERQPVNGALFALGERPLTDALAAAGHRLSDRPDEVGCVLAAFDRTFDYRKWTIAHRAIVAGARFIATNPDATYPTEHGEIPDCAGIIAALEASTGTRVQAVLGKPSKDFLEAALAKLGTPAQDTLVVGDRLDTDMAMALSGGLSAALVLSGVTTRADLARSRIRPTYVLDGVGELLGRDAGAALRPPDEPTC